MLSLSSIKVLGIIIFSTPYCHRLYTNPTHAERSALLPLHTYHCLCNEIYPFLVFTQSVHINIKDAVRIHPTWFDLGDTIANKGRAELLAVVLLVCVPFLQLTSLDNLPIVPDKEFCAMSFPWFRMTLLGSGRESF